MISGLVGATVFKLGVDVSRHYTPQPAHACWKQEVRQGTPIEQAMQASLPSAPCLCLDGSFENEAGVPPQERCILHLRATCHEPFAFIPTHAGLVAIIPM